MRNSSKEGPKAVECPESLNVSTSSSIPVITWTWFLRTLLGRCEVPIRYSYCTNVGTLSELSFTRGPVEYSKNLIRNVVYKCSMMDSGIVLALQLTTNSTRVLCSISQLWYQWSVQVSCFQATSTKSVYYPSLRFQLNWVADCGMVPNINRVCVPIVGIHRPRYLSAYDRTLPLPKTWLPSCPINKCRQGNKEGNNRPTTQTWLNLIVKNLTRSQKWILVLSMTARKTHTPSYHTGTTTYHNYFPHNWTQVQLARLFFHPIHAMPGR